MNARRIAMAVILGLVGAAGCPSDNDEGGDSSCASDFECLNGQVCQAGMCVAATGVTDGSASAGSASGGSASGGSASAGSASGGSASAGSASAGSASAGSADGGSADDATAGSSCSADEVVCSGPDTLDVCDDGEFVSVDCSEVCAASGWESNGCVDDVCHCGDPLDLECAVGVGGLCACLVWAGEMGCADEDYPALYEACYAGDLDVAKCIEDYVDGDTVDCAAAAVCL